jgi:hypothetical protein
LIVVCVLRTRLLLCEVAAGPKQQGSHPISHGLEEVQIFGRLDKQAPDHG